MFILDYGFHKQEVFYLQAAWSQLIVMLYFNENWRQIPGAHAQILLDKVSILLDLA